MFGLIKTPFSLIRFVNLSFLTICFVKGNMRQIYLHSSNIKCFTAAEITLRTTIRRDINDEVLWDNFLSKLAIKCDNFFFGSEDGQSCESFFAPSQMGRSEDGWQIFCHYYTIKQVKKARIRGICRGTGDLEAACSHLVSTKGKQKHPLPIFFKFLIWH